MSNDATPTEPREDDVVEEDRHQVIELFGVSLHVRNPRLAEVLRMDAKQALTTDVRDLVDQSSAKSMREEIGQAVPDVIVTPQTVHDEDVAWQRSEHRREVDGLGGALGFDVEPDGTWVSPLGISLFVRALEGSVSFAAAAGFVRALEDQRMGQAAPDDAALFVVNDSDSARVLTVAIRQQHLYGRMRTVSRADLSEIRSMMAAGQFDHDGVLALLAPIAAIDIGDVVSLLRSGLDSPSRGA